jgi:hypothetical protein
MTQEEKKYQDAYMADLDARRYILIEKLKKCRTHETYIHIINRLNAIEYKIECFQNRVNLHKEKRDKKISLRSRWEKSGKEVRIAISHR